MAQPPDRYHCPLCDDRADRWRLYPALGRPLCDDCDEALLDDDATFAAACVAFSVTPTLLMQIVEHQRPLLLSTAEVDRRFGAR
jgi:hypothetical protein